MPRRPRADQPPKYESLEAARSALMKRVRQKHTGPELAVRRALHAAGGRFRLHRRDLPGSPDIVMLKRKIVIFVALTS